MKCSIAKKLQNDGFKNFNKTLKMNLKSYWYYAVIYAAHAVTVYITIHNAIRYVNGILSLKYSSVENNIIIYLLEMLYPVSVWLLSSCFRKMNIERLKIGTMILCLLNSAICIVDIVFLAVCMFILPIISIPANRVVTASMIVAVARIISIVIPISAGTAFFYTFLSLIMNDDVKKMLMHYKFDRNIDIRFGKQYKYDLAVARDQKTGKIYRVKEDMRRYHCAAIGATGSGKTSMVFNPAIANDLDTRIRNENELYKHLEFLLRKKKIKITEIPDATDDILRKYFMGTSEKYEKKLDKLFNKYCMCGMTIIAPNSGFADDIAEMCINRGLTFNRIDPELDKDGKHKKGFIGLNPLYIRPGLDGTALHQEIINKARTFTDVLQALFEEGGSKDIYFSGLNRQFTSGVCTILMRTTPILHKKYSTKYTKPYTSPMEFYSVINNFSLITDYCTEMEQYLEEHPEDEPNYRNILTTIQKDFLGPGAKTMQEQIRGLVQQAYEILSNPLVRDILCNENTVDFDVALAESQITLVNYSLALGDSDSRALGLFILLLLQGAVFRRPSNNSPIHFVYVDEYPVLLHPKMSKSFSIFRQYNACMNVALQSLSQFDEKKETKFMKSVMLSNASTQIMFGRAGVEEMELYQKLGGKVNRVKTQESVNQSALSDENTSLVYSERSGIQQEDAVTGRDIRYKDFGEATMNTVDRGNIVESFPVILDFASYKKKKGIARVRKDWNKYTNARASETALEKTQVSAKEQLFESSAKVTYSKSKDAGFKDDDILTRQAKVHMKENIRLDSLSSEVPADEELTDENITSNSCSTDNNGENTNKDINDVSDDYIVSVFDNFGKFM